MADEQLKAWLRQARADLDAGRSQGGDECHRRYWLQRCPVRLGFPRALPDPPRSKVCPPGRAGATLSFVRLFLVPGLVLLAVACAESGEHEANSPAKSQAEVADFDKPLDTSAAADTRTYEAPPAETALLGARQDLTYAGPANATCECLAVAVGQPDDPTFKWAGQVPHTNPDTEFAVALTSAGVSCSAAGADALGASYWGYEQRGNDIVVVVERAAPGRPVASGAIIPHPIGNGQVYIRPVDAKLPYGRAAGGHGERCQVTHLSSASAPPTPSSKSSGFRLNGQGSDATKTLP